MRLRVILCMDNDRQRDLAIQVLEYSDTGVTTEVYFQRHDFGLPSALRDRGSVFIRGHYCNMKSQHRHAMRRALEHVKNLELIGFDFKTVKDGHVLLDYEVDT